MQTQSRIAEYLEDWKVFIQRDGPVSALAGIWADISQLPYRHLVYLVLSRSLSDPIPEFQPKIDLEVRPFEKSDLSSIREMDRPSEARLCARKLERGHKGFVAVVEGRPTGHAWGCDARDQELERIHAPYQAGDALLTDMFTMPAFRGQGIQTALTLARLRSFSELGYRRAICTIEVHNAPSLAVWQKKLGAVTEGQINFLRVGPWRKEHYRLDLPEKSFNNGETRSNQRLSQEDGR